MERARNALLPVRLGRLRAWRLAVGGLRAALEHSGSLCGFHTRLGALPTALLGSFRHHCSCSALLVDPGVLPASFGYLYAPLVLHGAMLTALPRSFYYLGGSNVLFALVAMPGGGGRRKGIAGAGELLLGHGCDTGGGGGDERARGEIQI